MLNYLILALLVLGFSAGDAQAKAKPAPAKEKAKVSDAAQPKGDWKIGMIKGEKGEFNYCLMRAEYNNDLSLAIALSPKQEINIGIGVPKAGFTKDEKHNMNVKIDGLFQKDTVALAANPELLIIPMHEDKKLYDALRKGKAITLAGTEDSSRFALKNVSKALQGLQTCVDVGTGKVKTTAAEDNKKGANKKDADKKAKAGEFPPALKGLLAQAGLTDMQLMTVKDPKKSPVDFAWKNANLFGGMRERIVPADATLEKMNSIIEGSYKKQCTGTFNVNKGAVESYSGIQMLNVDVSCDMEKHKAYVSLFMYLTDNHLFTLFMHESDAAHKADANKARDSIGNILRQMAKEQPPEKPADKPAEKK